ncbi:MAG: glycosyltransferase [Bacteroidota bacterium]|nr:glycosyltransferase [Bacteroidota bacterium]
MRKFSIIVPVFNRPDEMKELLESLAIQTEKNFELIIVEDGSEEKSDELALQYGQKIDINYFYKENEKPAIARNYGAKNANGDYLLFFDSDCILPKDYFAKINLALKKNYTDAFGGPDAAHSNFGNLQKAISYSMTSFFTTGGLRGSAEKLDKFYPRTFNMGVSRVAFDKIGGFPITKMHPGEDMVFSIELIKQGFTTQLIKDAFVYHKRRNTIKTFYKQVSAFGKTRIVISKLYPETFKIFFWAPTVFTLGTALLILLSFINPGFLLPIILYILGIFADSYIKNESIDVAGLSIITSFTQLFGYGIGFLNSYINVHGKNKDEYDVFDSGFYKAE